MFSNIWGADSGDIVSAIFTQGSIHPPSFPIYYLLGQLFRHIPLGTPTQRIALISFLFACLTLVNIYFILRFIFKNKSKTTIGLVSILSSLCLFFCSPSYLIYSLTPEIYTTSIFFITLNSYFILRVIDKFDSKYHLLFWLTFFLGLFFHYLILINLFIYFLLNWNKLEKIKIFVKKYIHKLLAFLTISIVPYVFFYLSWDKTSPIYWENKNLLGLLRLIFRSQYGFFSTSQGSYQQFIAKFQNLIFYFHTLISNFTVFGLLLAILGIIHILKFKKRFGQLFVLLCLLYGPVFIFYIDADMNTNFSKAIVERFLLLSFPFMTIFICSGYFFINQSIDHFSSLLVKNTRLKDLTVKIVLVLLLVLFPLAFAFKNIIFIAKLAKNKYFMVHSNNIIKSLPKNSILLLGGDMNLFPVQYYRYVLKEREDIILISLSKLSKLGYQKTLKVLFPYLIIPNSKIKRFEYEFIKKNLSHRRVYTSVFINGPDIKLKGHGFLDEIILKSYQDKSIEKFDIDYKFLISTNYTYPVYFFEALKDKYSSYYFNQMLKYKKRNNITLAFKAIATAYQIDANQHDINTNYALLLYKKGNCEKAKLILIQDYLNKETAEAAFILSRFFASCDHNFQKYLYWNQKYRELK